MTVPPLDTPRTQDALMEFEAVQLFLARTRQHQPDFEITHGNAAAITEICTILEGVPLAFELAAASLRRMSLIEMLALLRAQGWVSQLASPARDLPFRQRTLENVIEWSYNLLDLAEQDFFCDLSIFASWFESEAASAVSDIPTNQAGYLLGTLDDHSLLVGEHVHGIKSWRMLELVHDFAAGKLADDRRSQLEARRGRYFLEKIRELKRTARREDQEAYFQVNRSNFHGALKWAIATNQPELGLELASELDSLWSSLGYFKEGLDLVRQLLSLPSSASPKLRSAWLQTASDLAWQQYDFETALDYARQAAELGRTHSLEREYPWYLNRMGRIYIEQNKLVEARETLSVSLELAYQHPAEINPGAPMAQLGEVAFFEGHLEEAQNLLEKALTHLAQDDDIFLAIAKTDLAEIALANHEFDRARDWLQQAFEPACKQARRLMVFLSALSGYLVLSSPDDCSRSVKFYGALDGLSESSGVTLSRFYLNVNEERIRQVRKRHSDSDWQMSYQAGRQWKRDELLLQIKKVL